MLTSTRLFTSIQPDSCHPHSHRFSLRVDPQLAAAPKPASLPICRETDPTRDSDPTFLEGNLLRPAGQLPAIHPRDAAEPRQ